MAYTKQTWETGDIVTAEKLNHIENGVFNSAGVVYIPVVKTETSVPGGETTTYTYSSDYSYDDIAEAVAAGRLPIAAVEGNRDGLLMTAYFPPSLSWAETEELYGAFGFGISGEIIYFNSDGSIGKQPHEKQQAESNT